MVKRILIGAGRPCIFVPTCQATPCRKTEYSSTDKRRLTTGIRSYKCVVRRFCCCANVYLHKPREYSIAYYTPRLYGIAYCS